MEDLHIKTEMDNNQRRNDEEYLNDIDEPHISDEGLNTHLSTHRKL